jgi:hypothetical protein
MNLFIGFSKRIQIATRVYVSAIALISAHAFAASHNLQW